MENFNHYVCSQRDTAIIEDESYLFEDEIFCEECLGDETFICAHCNKRFYNNRKSGDDDTPVCEHCFNYYYTNCDRCDNIIACDDAYYAEDDEDSDNPYCFDCYERYGKNVYLQSYNYKPSPIFHGNGKCYYGVELEIDVGGKNERNAKILCTLANKYYENIYIKTDGSLNDGLEIVTHPMCLEYHIKEMPWKPLMERALELGYISHQTESCGLHIHINRNRFSNYQCFQDECIARVLYIVERFWEELLRFSRRTESQLKRWANRYGYKQSPSDILDSAKNSYSGRYTCVNITNYETIEFRIFRGTLKYNTLIATLQLVELICNVAFSLSDEEVAKIGWCDFMERISPDECPELITYLKERRLYLNEIVNIIIGEE